MRRFSKTASVEVDCVWNVMAHSQKPDFVFRLKGRVRLNRRRRQFSRLLAAEVVCASAVVMLDTPCTEVVWEYWLPTPFDSFPFTSPPVRRCVASRCNWTLPQPHCMQKINCRMLHWNHREGIYRTSLSSELPVTTDNCLYYRMFTAAVTLLRY